MIDHPKNLQAPDPSFAGLVAEGNAEQSATRWKRTVYVLGALLSLFQLYTAFFGAYVSIIQGAIHLGLASALIFLVYPISPAHRDTTWRRIVDLALAAAAAGACFYIQFNYDRLVDDAILFGYSGMDVVVASTGIILVLEATRRSVGAPIVIIAVVALMYSLFGNYSPVFTHSGMSWSRLATESFFTTSSVFGTPIQVSATFIYLFLFFGVVLIETNVGKFFTDIAFLAVGRFTGGPAKAAVIASGLQGMVSGSSVSNTVASGSFTIPMMKQAGFRPEFAGATEASASTGGQLAPPVMGAAAFIMAAMTGVPYNEIIVLAAGPAILYFLGVFISVHFEAKRMGITGLRKEDLPRRSIILRKLYLFAPLLVIVLVLLSGRTPTFAALLAIGATIGVSFVSAEDRLDWRSLLGLLQAGARAALPVIAACATAGIIAGTVTITGLGGKLASTVIEIAAGQFSLTLIMTMLACLVLGMGLPTTANYVVTATVAAPILAAHFGTPVIAAHMFVFYFGILADITPPVCLAAYAGAGIAGANPMRTGVIAFKLAIGALIVPYAFMFNPALLLQDAHIGYYLFSITMLLFAITAVSSAMGGFLLVRSTVPERWALLAAGLVLISPQPEPIGVGLTVLALVVIKQAYRRFAAGGSQG